jgi:type II secretory pathway component PulM
MINFVIHGNKWVFIAIFGGGVALAAVVLTCWAMWKPREEEREAQKEEITDLPSFITWLRGIAPWALILAVVGTTAYSIIHTALAALKTPNW